MLFVLRRWTCAAPTTCNTSNIYPSTSDPPYGHSPVNPNTSNFRLDTPAMGSALQSPFCSVTPGPASSVHGSEYETPVLSPLSFLAPMDDMAKDTSNETDEVLFDDLVPRQRKPKISRDASLLAVLQGLRDLKCTVVELLLLIIEGTGGFAVFRTALFSPQNRASLIKLFDTLVKDVKGGPIVTSWMSSHAIHLVCEKVHKEMENAKPSLRMSTGDVTPEFIEQWDIHKIMKSVSEKTTPTFTTILEAAGESKASQAKEKTAKSKNRETVGTLTPSSK